MPTYKRGKQTGRKTPLVYSIDLVRGLDVYRVTLPGQEPAAGPATPSPPIGAAVLPGGLFGGALMISVALSRAGCRRRSA